MTYDRVRGLTPHVRKLNAGIPPGIQTNQTTLLKSDVDSRS